MIAIICPVHRNPQVAAAQIRNYAFVHGESAFHILHPSLECGDTFSNFVNSYDLNSEVVLCEDRFQTSYYTALGAAISATNMIKANYSDVTHVYMHTDGDLLVTMGFEESIIKNGNGYISRKAGEKWYPYKAMLKDPRFLGVRDDFKIDLDDIRIGRQEGCFFEIELWLEMFRAISKHFSKDSLTNPLNHWPFEACLFPTLARKIIGQEHASTRNLILTKNHRNSVKGQNVRDLEANMLQVEDVKNARDKNRLKSCIGMKWFSTDLDHPARSFVTECLKKDTKLDAAP